MAEAKQKYRVASEFTAQGDGELSVALGDLLFAPQGNATNGWLFVQTLHEPKRSGYVPVSYLQREPSKAELQQEQHRPPTQTTKNAANPFDSVPPENTDTSSGTVAQVNGYQAAIPPRGASSVPDQYRTSHAAKFKKTLEYWRERERRFLAGEEEKLPVAKRRVYFYWDKNGVRHGPLTEQQMRAKFESREVAATTTVALATDDNGEELQKKSVAEFFPEVHKAFQTVPLVKDDGLWWCYLDDVRNIQGPFAAEQMYEWFQEGYFNADTLVQLSTRLDQPFVPLSSLFPDGAGAFLTEGLPVAHNPPVVAAPAPQPQPSNNLALNFDPSFQPLQPIQHEPDFFTKPLNATSNAVPPAVSTRFTQSQLGDVLDDPGGWRVEADPWSVQPQQQRSTEFDSKLNVDEFDPLVAGASGRNLLARALSSQDELGKSTAEKNLNINDIKIELSNPLGEAGGTTEVDVDPYNLDWFTENAGKDIELHVDMPEPEPVEAAKLKRAASSKKKQAEKAPAEKKKPSKRKLASLQTIRTNHLHSLEALYVFLTRPLPKTLGIVQCRIKRITTGLHVRANLYQLYLESGGKRLGPQILRATKHRQSVRSHYLIRIGDVNKRENGKPICEFIHNHRGTQFVLHNDVVDHIGRPRDLCCLSYTSNFEKQGGPRKLKVALPAFKDGSEIDVVDWSHVGNKPKDSRMMNKFNDLQLKGLLVLRNKAPKWNAKRRSWTLDFHGRVKTSSVKNFQLINPKEEDRVILQHGKVGFDDFTMDMQWPMSPVAAFAICLSSLHGKLAVE